MCSTNAVDVSIKMLSDGLCCFQPTISSIDENGHWQFRRKSSKNDGRWGGRCRERCDSVSCLTLYNVESPLQWPGRPLMRQ
jgi:hypothetical protein